MAPVEPGASKPLFPPYRIEIPTIESPAALRSVIEESRKLDVPVHRVSQGSGMMMLTASEIRDMVALGAESRIEVCLFVGPRAAWDTGAMASSSAGSALRANLRGAEQIKYALDDIRRGCSLGVRSIMFADFGLLQRVSQLRQQSELPRDLKIKISIMGGYSNPDSIRLLQDLGADSINIPSDITLPELGLLRQILSVPMDLYVESPDEFGGFLRYWETPAIVQAAAPVYLKFGVRNAPNLYPYGGHLEEICLKLAREKVRRARLALEILDQHHITAPFEPELRHATDHHR